MKRFVLIVAGGTGTRMGNDLPKQFLPVNNEPVLAHTLRKFDFPGYEIHLVLHPDWIQYWKDLVKNLSDIPPHSIHSGGSSRAESVKNGIAQLSGEGLVAVHDAARPLVSKDLILRLFEIAEAKGNAIPVIPIRDSIREKDGENSKAVPRSKYVGVQTPQLFSSSFLKKAFEKQGFEAFTDEASLAETFDVQLHLVAGEENNIKVTVPGDLIFAEALLARGI